MLSDCYSYVDHAIVQLTSAMAGQASGDGSLSVSSTQGLRGLIVDHVAPSSQDCILPRLGQTAKLASHVSGVFAHSAACGHFQYQPICVQTCRLLTHEVGARQESDTADRFPQLRDSMYARLVHGRKLCLHQAAKSTPGTWFVNTDCSACARTNRLDRHAQRMILSGKVPGRE